MHEFFGNGKKCAPRGIALLLTIIAAAVIQIGASVVLVKLQSETKRERLREFNFVLKSYRDALSLFRKKYGRNPKKIEELNGKNPEKIKFIRRLYPDPLGPRPFGFNQDHQGEITDIFSEYIVSYQ